MRADAHDVVEQRAGLRRTVQAVRIRGAVVVGGGGGGATTAGWEGGLERQVEGGAALAVEVGAGGGGADAVEAVEEVGLAREDVGDGVGRVEFARGGAAVEDVVGTVGEGGVAVRELGWRGDGYGAGAGGDFSVFDGRVGAGGRGEVVRGRELGFDGWVAGR